MRRHGLNLEALRGEGWRTGRPTQATVTDLLSSSGELALTRRELLTLAGMAAVALPPFEKTLAPALLGPVEYVAGPKRAAFRLRGRDRWVIDPRRFAGNPRLAIHKTDNYVRLELKGARYPGTQLPADMVCELRRGLSGWRMRMRMALGGFRGEVPLESWLAGVKPCRARVRLKGESCQVGERARLTLSGDAEAEFHPDWRLEIKGEGVGRLTGFDEVLVSDTVALCMPERGTPSLMKDPPARRTAVIIGRGGHEWRLGGGLPSPRHGKVVADAQAFDEIRLEVGEGARASGRAALLAYSAAGSGRLRCLFGGRGANGDGDGAFEMALRNPRFAVAVEPAGEQAALVSDFDDEAGWLHAEGYSLQLGGAPDCPPFEVVAYDGQVRRMRCEPALLKVSVPLPDAVTEPTPVAPGTRIALVTAGMRLAQVQQPPVVRPAPQPRRPTIRRPTDTQTQPTQPTTPAQPPAGAVQVRPGRPTVVRLPSPTITVIRPEDLLCLTFEFINLEVKGQPPQLQRVKTDAPAYIIVHFQPQHIAEEAILEDAPEFGQMEKENIPSPPVHARMAGRSRLAFRLPAGMNQVPLTLSALLDWTKFELSVVPLALPPPEPARVTVPGRFIEGYKLPTPATLPKQPVLEAPPPEGQEAPQPGPVLPAPRLPSLPEDDDKPTNRAEIRFVAAAQPAPRVEPAAPASATPTAQQPAATATARVPAPSRFVYMSVREPLKQETSIEAPYRLMVSPHAGVGWVHAPGKVEHGGRTELWHTRMGVRTADGKIYDRQYEYVVKDGKLVVSAASPAGDVLQRLRTLRCVWSPDYSWPPPTAPDKPTPFRMSLDQRDRAELVALTCGYGRMADWQSRVVETDTLMLSSLGAWMNVRYGADLPKEDLPLTIEEWRHRMAMGRDQYVSVVYAGYLFPFGHRACLVKVTERKFAPVGQGYVAYLFQRYFLRVREPVKYYPAYGQANNARRMPLRSVRILTLVTPTLRAPEQTKVLPDQPCSARCGFWPTVGDQPFRFRMVGEDWDGQQVEFEVPVIFVGVENVTGTTDRLVAFDEQVMGRFVEEYNKNTPEMRARRTAPVAGHKMAFAESTPSKPGDTTLQVEELLLGAELDDPKARKTQKDLRANNQPRFYPNVAAAKVRLPAVEQITGKETPTEIRIHDEYVEKGWSSNPAGNKAEVFAQLWDIAAGKAASLPLGFSADQSGGLATPDMSVEGLSKQFGPVSDLAKMLAGNFDPSSFFPDTSLLFGAVKLKDILEAIFGPDQIPTLTTNIEKDEYGVPKAIVAKLTWQPKMKPWPAGKPIFATRSGTSLKIEATMRTELSLSGPAKTSARVEGKMEKFDLNLVPVGGYDYFIQLQFDSISFVSGTGHKTDVKCDFGNMRFGGPLEFVNTLQKLIPLNGFGDGPYLDVGLDGIKAGFSLEIPDVAMGMFALSNMRLAADLRLPFFGGSLRFRFAFCEKESPFTLAVSMFGGGGFFALEVSPKEIVLIEAAFEFGGSIGFDCGVASGGVYAMAGIYFRWETEGITLEGYLRMGGHLSVLGLVTLSLEFYMSLTYKKSGASTSVVGRAELTVEIEILFFSMSVTMSVERQFAGSSSGSAYLDGTRFAMLATDARFAQGGGGGASGASQRVRFADQMTAADWAAYCKAFD